MLGGIAVHQLASLPGLPRLARELVTGYLNAIDWRAVAVALAELWTPADAARALSA